MNEKQQKLLEQIDHLLQKAEEVKATHTPNPPNVIGFPTLQTAAFSEWKNSAESLITRVTGRDSSYYANFQKEVKHGHRSHVEAGAGILRALRGEVQDGLYSSKEEESSGKENTITNGGGEDANLSGLRMKLGILEFVVAALFALCFTLIFAMIKILGLEIYWSALWPYLLMFFGLAFSGMYILLPAIQISRKVGPNVKDIYDEFILEFKGKSKLGKMKTLGSIFLGLAAVVSLVITLLPYLDKYL